VNASSQGLTDGRLINSHAVAINSRREPNARRAGGSERCQSMRHVLASVRLKRVKLIDSARRFSDRRDLELPSKNRGIDRPICTAGVSYLSALGTQLDRLGEAVEDSRVHA